jgi:hypothetical protein
MTADCARIREAAHSIDRSHLEEVHPILTQGAAVRRLLAWHAVPDSIRKEAPFDASDEVRALIAGAT